MPRIRIIIADFDYNFIFPLQVKFVEQFANMADIEIIDDISYFKCCFSKPQSADVLVVGKEWHSSELLRHDIDTIFVLSDSKSKEDTDLLNVFQISRSESSSDIFNQIVNSSHGLSMLQPEKNTHHKEPQMLVVYSPSGGTGVTTLALALSAYLSRKQKRVLYIEAARINSFQSHLKTPGFLSSPMMISRLGSENPFDFGEVKKEIRKEGFNYFPPLKTAIISYGVKYNSFRRLATAAKDSGEYNFVIVDADSTFDEDKAELLEIADKVLIVVEPSSASISAVKTLAGCISGIMTDEKYLFIGSKSRQDSKFSDIHISASVGIISDYENKTIDDIVSAINVAKISNLIV